MHVPVQQYALLHLPFAPPSLGLDLGYQGWLPWLPRRGASSKLLLASLQRACAARLPQGLPLGNPLAPNLDLPQLPSSPIAAQPQPPTDEGARGTATEGIAQVAPIATGFVNRFCSLPKSALLSSLVSPGA
ncbi:hypothetical protein CDD81_1962 [Ophiocordyceps australis]|uniref:Uncharacterized protein n=1 Tax=Ophiocordyceps australis TaxID=1399860 RepID=A0A2C5XYY8_9HYPO|nr:hypothetical protein CDD81_1962 [Ophiocordyceps australis]